MDKTLSQKKVVVGIAGEICAGKDTIASMVLNDLKNKGVRILIVRSSDILREIFSTIEIEPRRIDFHNITEFLRHHYGEDILSQIMGHRIETACATVVLWVGLRSRHDIEVLRRFSVNKLVFIEATAEERFRRICKRDENIDDREKTWEQFIEDSNRSTEKTIRTFRSWAEMIINNEDDHIEESCKLFSRTVKNWI
jgi:uridine kinase